MSYFGESGAGNSSASSGSSSSRKGKKSSGSDKPKQPQRGLGVAQLEKIRLHSQMGFLPQEDIRIQTPYSSSSSSFSYTSPSTASFNTFQGHQSHMMQMGMGELERTNIVYGESQPSINPRWDGSTAILEAQRYAHPVGIERHLFLSPELEEDSSRRQKRNDQNSMGSSSQNSDSNGSQEVDLELRLSL